jgi:hypothetical protein
MALSEWSLPTFSEFLNKSSQVLEDAKQSTSEFYQAGVIAYNEGTEAVESKIEEAKYALWELLSAQQEVDARISQMDEGPEKQALTAKRDESRSFFNQNIAPLAAELASDQAAYENISIGDSLKFSNFSGVSEKPRETWSLGLDSYMGLLPVVPLALGAGAVAVSAALIYWAHEAYALERAILNDPTLKPGEKYSLALKASESGIMGSLVKLKLPLFLGLALAGLYLVLPSGDSSRKAL